MTDNNSHLGTTHSSQLRKELSTLPEEIILLLFENLDECASACLGITCRKMYRLHRIVHPSPVELRSYSLYLVFQFAPEVKYSKSLYELIEGWVGTKYRWSECFETFVNREVFGETDAEEECGRLCRH